MKCLFARSSLFGTPSLGRLALAGSALGTLSLGTLGLASSGCGTVTGVSDPQNAQPLGPGVPEAPAPETCADNPLLAGCSTDPAPTTPAAGSGTDAASLAKAAAENVLDSDCGQCHGPALTPEQAQAGMNYINDIDQLVATGKIVPLNSAGSLIIQRMQKGEMPPPDSGLPRVTDADINTVASYIDNPVFWPEYVVKPLCLVQNLIDFDGLYHTVSEDILTARGEDAKFYRYISLTNRDATGCDNTTLTQNTQALTKMLNMLSTRAQIGQMTSIDPTQSIFRIDLRDFNWDRSISVAGQKFNDVWDAVAAANPYAVAFVGRDADLIKSKTGANISIMFGDQMLHVAPLGELYYSIIGVDTKGTLNDFVSKNLGVDVQGDVQSGRAMRAGTTKSRVSRQDRLVERHDLGSRSGVLWESFDFEPGSKQSIFADPFGFSPGATDAIFTLPNGMLAYIIADANDHIADSTDILLDTSQADFRAVTAISCSNCHALGFIPVIDEVRDFVVANALQLRISGNDLHRLQQIYVDPTAFAQQVDKDSKGFYQSALTSAGLPPISGDPVAGLFLRFEGDVSADQAAADLGLDTQVLKDNIELLDPTLSPLKQDGTVSRANFTQVYVASLCRMSTVLINTPNDADCKTALAAVKARGG